MTPTAAPERHLANTRNSDPLNDDNDLRDFRKRRRRRYELRNVLWQESTIRRCQWCGRIPGRAPGGAQATPEIRINDGVAHYSGVGRCGSVWACPVCSPKIRQGRALEFEQAARTHLGRGGAIVFLTLTMPHDFGESLAELMDTITASNHALYSGRPWRRDREDFGIRHSFRTWDSTHGRNGWHPHQHGALFLDRRPSPEELDELTERLFDRYADAIESRGHRRPSREHGIRVELARSPKELAGYLLKVEGEDSGRNLALELARGDLKRGAGRTPFEILAAFRDTGDLAELALWHEWEKATKGRHFSQWSRGARAELGLVEECSDEELAEAEVGGEVVHTFTFEEWHAVAGHAAATGCGALTIPLRIAETAGAGGVAEYLTKLTARWRAYEADRAA